MNGKEERILGITGNCNTLGKWGEIALLRMFEIQPNVWQLTLDGATLPPGFDYKYVAIDPNRMGST